MKHISLRIDEELLQKFHFVCQYHVRSANQQILMLIKQSVEEYEEKFGKITEDDIKAMYRNKR